MSIVTDIVKGVTGPVADYLNERQKLRSAERIRKAELADAVHARNLEAARAGLVADVDWEMEFARQAGNSWKDEFELVVVTLPLVGCWIFPVQTLSGFAVLAKCPPWYVGLVLTIYLANYGIRKWRRKTS
jgi:hypothetical protein